jgi:hypothetical protein
MQEVPNAVKALLYMIAPSTLMISPLKSQGRYNAELAATIPTWLADVSRFGAFFYERYFILAFRFAIVISPKASTTSV